MAEKSEAENSGDVDVEDDQRLEEERVSLNRTPLVVARVYFYVAVLECSGTTL